MWNVYADPLTSLPDRSKFCPISFDTDVELVAARSWIVLYNNPTFTGLTLGIYTDIDGLPGDLLFESTNMQLKNEIMSSLSNSAARDIWFEFTQLPQLREGQRYNFMLGGTGYTFTSASHIAWKKAYPDPAYTNGFDVNDFRKLSLFPYDLSILGREL